MSQKKLSIRWKDGRCIVIYLLDNPVAEYYYHCMKHLQHIDLEFNVRKNPLHPLRYNINQLLDQMIASAKEVDVIVDSDRLLDQEYLNYLHNLYFNSTDGHGSNSPKWLRFHDLIHSIEQVRDREEQGAVWVDYEHLAGPLVKPFNRDWLKYSIPVANSGTCYIEAHELGKTICKYIYDNEPNDIDIMCKLLKPWVDMKPVMNIAIQDQDRNKNLKFLSTHYKEQLDYWLENFQKPWRDYWKLTEWDIMDEGSALPIGHIDDVDTLIDCFKNEDYPTRITY